MLYFTVCLPFSQVDRVVGSSGESFHQLSRVEGIPASTHSKQKRPTAILCSRAAADIAEDGTEGHTEPSSPLH